MGNTHIPRARNSGGARAAALRIGVPIAVVGVAIATVSAQAAQATATVSHTPAAVGSIAAVPAGAKAAAAPSAAAKIDVDVALEPRNAAELQQYAELVSDPTSPLYKQYLTQRQTQLLFAPAQSTVDAVSAALRSAGLSPGAAIDDNLYVPVSATFGQLEHALKIGFSGYRLANGQTAFDATSVPKLDQSVASDVRGFIGLDDFAKPSTGYQAAKTTHPRSETASAAALAGESAAHGHGAVPTLCASLTSAVDASVAQYYDEVGQDGSTYYSPTALASAYGYAGQLTSGNRGQGVTVAVDEWEAVSSQAVSDYENCVGADNHVSYDNSAAGTQAQPTATNGVGIESSLDIEAIAAVAPKASIIDYEGPDISATFTDADWLDNLAAPVAADSANLISLSWGQCEQGAIDTTLEGGETTTLRLAAVQGQSFFVAAGDNGSETCGTPTVAVDDPADNPWATAVGATNMQGIHDPTVAVWNDSDHPIPGTDNGGATGGGVSAWYSFSSGFDYQAGFAGAGYANLCDASAGTTCRLVPDLSTDGDWRTGLPDIYYADASGYDAQVVGGTSASAPLMAGITALADSSARCAANGPAGFINPLIYQLAKNPATYAANFVDETTGDNAYTPTGYTGSLYQATKGYDMASGLGSPRAGNLIPSLCTANPWVGDWSFGRSALGQAAAHGQAAVDKAVTAESAESAEDH